MTSVFQFPLSRRSTL